MGDAPRELAFAGAGVNGGRQGRTWARRCSAALAALVVLSMPATPARVESGAGSRSPLVDVVVQASTGMSGVAQRSVLGAGGIVTRRFAAIDSFVAKVPAAALQTLRRTSSIDGVTANRPIRLFNKQMTGDALHGANSLDHVRKVIGANVLDKLGYDGSGVGVALLDSGVVPVAGLDGAGKISNGPDVSRDGSMHPSTAHLDGFGHGTHLAGIIGGADPSTVASGQRFLGVAEGSRIVSVRTASGDGSTDLLGVLASIDWIIQHRADANIRVLNLSFGVTASADYRSDPLAYAVEKAWKAGIVVVVAGGNDGDLTGSPITSPGTDPFVITVGSTDTLGTDDTSDDVVQTFSPKGSAARRVDLVAPGQSILSLRNPGSYADTNWPDARYGDRLFKGTGTSQATAVVSGAIADIVQQRPDITPDQVKALLKATATPLPAADPVAQGSGELSLKKAIRTATPVVSQSFDPAALPSPPPAPDGSAFTTDTWSGGSWSGGSWSGGSWSGGSWSGGSWSGGSWSGGSWSGGSWSGGSWSGGSWSGGSWSGGSWSGGSWSGGSWSGGSWSGGSWSGGSWSGAVWKGATWR